MLLSWECLLSIGEKKDGEGLSLSGSKRRSVDYSSPFSGTWYNQDSNGGISFVSKLN